MGTFDSLHSFTEFEQSVKTKARFVHDDRVRRFLTTVLETSLSRRRTLPKDQTLFRAQPGFTWSVQPIFGEGEEAPETVNVEAAHPLDRMLPKAECVGDGRINPRGIPCLYLASNPGAALAEMRPWVGSYITLARFQVVRDCVVVDCSRNTTQSILLEPIELDVTKKDFAPDHAAKEVGVWGDIGYAFSKPVTRDEPHLDYVPTQILGEAFRNHGFQGVVYRSLLDETGRNIALFDIEAAQIVDCALYKTHEASLEFAKRDGGHFWPEVIAARLRHVDPIR